MIIALWCLGSIVGFILFIIIIAAISNGNERIEQLEHLCYAEKMRNECLEHSLSSLRSEFNNLESNFIWANKNLNNLDLNFSKVKSALENYLDIEWEIPLKYKDKRINKLKLLYDHLNLDIKTIDATPVQYKLVKKEKPKT